MNNDVIPMDIHEELDMPTTFTSILNSFQYAIHRETSFRNDMPITNINFCCNDNERDYLLNTANDLKNRFPNISNNDICIAIIYEYYALNLSEQSEFNLSPSIFQRYEINYFSADNVKHVNDLIFYITSSDDPLAKSIRRNMLGIRGGKRKKSKKSMKSKKSKKSMKSKKNKKRVRISRKRY
jgi:hypothetical protein